MIDATARRFLSEIRLKGGKKSRRTLRREQAQKMVEA
jgi:hypothetical protein